MAFYPVGLDPASTSVVASHVSVPSPSGGVCGHGVNLGGHGLDRRIVHELPPDRAPAASWPAARAATAMMVRAGLAAPWVGSTLPSVM